MKMVRVTQEKRVYWVNSAHVSYVSEDGFMLVQGVNLSFDQDPAMVADAIAAALGGIRHYPGDDYCIVP